jgi:hypothetical protein
MRIACLKPALLGIALALICPRAGATTFLDFEGLPPFTDAATLSLKAVQVSTAYVVDEASAAVVTGFPASAWAISGTSGLLNSLAAAITFEFPNAVESFSVALVGFPSGAGFQSVKLEAFAGADLLGEVLSDPSQLGDSGFHEAILGAGVGAGGLGITRVVLSPATDPGLSTSFFLDNVAFAVPEPGTAGLLLLGLAGLSGLARRGTL